MKSMGPLVFILGLIFDMPFLFIVGILMMAGVFGE